MKLTETETELWHAWKKATDAVMRRVERDILTETGLSGADFGVLSRIQDREHGQQELATSLGWDKSRLSHQLSRMEERGLLLRRRAEPKNVTVRISPRGKAAITAARPVHAGAVRMHLVDKVPPSQRDSFLRTLERLRATT